MFASRSGPSRVSVPAPLLPPRSAPSRSASILSRRLRRDASSQPTAQEIYGRGAQKSPRLAYEMLCKYLGNSTSLNLATVKVSEKLAVGRRSPRARLTRPPPPDKSPGFEKMQTAGAAAEFTYRRISKCHLRALEDF